MSILEDRSFVVENFMRTIRTCMWTNVDSLPAPTVPQQQRFGRANNIHVHACQICAYVVHLLPFAPTVLHTWNTRSMYGEIDVDKVIISYSVVLLIG